MKAPPALSKHPSNPVLSAEDVPYLATTVFNAGVVYWEGRYIMMFRNDYSASGTYPFDGCNLGLAESKDGVDWTVWREPVWTLERARKACAAFYDARFGLDEILRFYDPRLTVIEDRCYLCFALDTLHGIRGGIAVTSDFEHFDILSLSVPDNRNMVLFPERIGGRFVRLERPFPVYSKTVNNPGAADNPQHEAFDIWLCDSENLRDWGDARLVLGAEEVPFANGKIGPAAPPLRTPRGWLTTFHAVWKDDAHPLKGWEQRPWCKTYHAGLMLLDLHQPDRVVAMRRTPLLTPDEPYEEDGFRGSVIFPCGLVAGAGDEVKIYYGAADTCVALATASLDDLVASCEPFGPL